MAKEKKYIPSNRPPSKVQEPIVDYAPVKLRPPVIEDFTYHQFQQISGKVPFTQKEWANILHLSDRTLQRYAKDNSTTPAYLTDTSGNKINNDSSSYIVVPITYDMISAYVITGANNVFLFEIYRPKKASKDQFYFPSVFLPIGNPGMSNRYHTDGK